MNAITQTSQLALRSIPMSEIHLSFQNARKRIDPDVLTTLKESITSVGLLQPLVVTERDEGGYTLVGGFTRHRALTELNYDTVNVSVVEGDEALLLEAHVAENVARQDLSLVSSVAAVKRLATRCGNDYEEVGRRLGFNKKQMDDRIALALCSDNVLDALEDETIRLGHAIILSAFTHKLQDATLEKIIDEKLTVEQLKERAGKAKVTLKLAKFDCAECVGCAHNSNSNTQGALFDEVIERDICSNTQCFSDKQEKWLTSERYRLKDEYGTLLDASTVDNNQIRLVDVAVLGQEQHQACLSCANNVSILDNRLKSPSIGQVRDQVCNNVDCFTKCAQSFAQSQVAETQETESVDAQAPQTGGEASDISSTAGTAASIPAKPEKAKPALESSLSGGKQKDMANILLAKAVLDSFGSDPLDELRLTYLAVRNLTHNRWSFMNNSLDEIRSLSAEQLQEAISQSLLKYITEGAEKTGWTELPETNSGMGLLHTLALVREHPAEVVTYAWTVDALDGYPKAAIEAICEQSGFAEHYESTNGEGSFKKLVGQKKSEILEAIGKSDFEWRDYAPAGYLNRFKNSLPEQERDNA